MKLNFLNKSGIIQKRGKQFFDGMRDLFTESSISNEYVINLYNRFREFFTSLGKPTLKVRSWHDGKPPYVEDYNQMQIEAKNDIDVLFDEAETISNEAIGVFQHAEIMKQSVQSMIDLSNLHLDHYALYTGDFGDQFVTIVDDFNNVNNVGSGGDAEVDTVRGLVSLPVLEQTNYGDYNKGTVVHECYGYLNSADYVSTTGNRHEAMIPNKVDSDLNQEEDDVDPIQDETLGEIAVEQVNEVVPTYQARGMNLLKWSLIDDNPETAFEWESLWIPDSIKVCRDIGAIWPTGDVREYGTVVAKMREAFNTDDINGAMVKWNPNELKDAADQKTMKITTFTGNHGWVLDGDKQSWVNFYEEANIPDEQLHGYFDIFLDSPVPVDNITLLPVQLSNNLSGYNPSKFKIVDVKISKTGVEPWVSVQEYGQKVNYNVGDNPVVIRLPSILIKGIQVKVLCDEPYRTAIAHPYSEFRFALRWGWVKKARCKKEKSGDHTVTQYVRLAAQEDALLDVLKYNDPVEFGKFAKFAEKTFNFISEITKGITKVMAKGGLLAGIALPIGLILAPIIKFIGKVVREVVDFVFGKVSQRLSHLSIRNDIYKPNVRFGYEKFMGYRYWWGFRNVDILSSVYGGTEDGKITKAELVSREWNIGRKFDRVELSVDEDVPPIFNDTSAGGDETMKEQWIKYQVSFDGIQWYDISPRGHSSGTPFLFINHKTTTDVVNIQNIQLDDYPTKLWFKAILNRPNGIENAEHYSPYLYKYTLKCNLLEA